MKRHIVKGLVVSLLLAIIVVGSMPAGADTEISTSEAVVAQDDPLVVWAISDIAEDMEALGAQFEEEFGVPVNVQELGFGEIATDLLNFGPVGEGPDVLVTENASLGRLVENGALVPIDLTGMEDLFEPSALSIFTYQNQIWAVPYAWENVALVRNTELVPDAPATWQEVREISEQLVDSGTSQYGFMLQSGNPYHSYPIVTAFGGYIFGENADGTYNVADIGLNSEGGLAAAQWISDMYADGLMVLDVNDDVMFELFAANDVAMFITGPWWSQRIIDADVPYSLDPLPGAVGGLDQGRPFAGGFAFAISAFSDKQLLAESFILDFLATQEPMERILLADEGTALTRFPAFLEVDASNDPNIAGFIAAGQFAQPMPQIPEMGAVWASWADALTLVGQGDDPAATFDVAVDQIATAIDLVQAEERVAGVPGDFQDEVGCEADWNPACEVTLMTPHGEGIYTLTLTVPAGDWQYKVAMNGGWDESYGPDGCSDCFENIMFSLSEETAVSFVYDDNINIIMDSVNDDLSMYDDLLVVVERFVGVPGDYQDEVGCGGDWDPACEATIMEAQGDGIFTLTVTIPAGDYQYKVAMNGAWDENYGADGAQNGDNILLSLSEETEVTFTYDDNTNVITDSVNGN